MIVDKIAEEIFYMRKEFFNKAETLPGKEPEFAVYMDQETYHTMMSEISGRVSSHAMEVIETGKISNQKVYRVVDGHHPWKIFRLN